MNNISRVAVVIAALLPASVLAQSIKGVVLNNQGKAVANATVDLEGSDQKVTTNDKGEFEISGLNNG